MPLHRPRFPGERDPHVATRTLAGVVAALGLALGLVYWPASGKVSEPVVYYVDREAIPLELVDVPQTTAPPPPANLAPPPPPPSDLDAPPIEVEDLIDVEDLEVAPFEIREPTPRPAAPGPPAPPAPPGPSRPAPPGVPAPGPSSGDDAGPALVRNPDSPPRNRMVRLPVCPDEARRAGMEGRATVEILVTEGGRVESFEILDRVVIRGGREERVSRLPAGMEESAAEAIQRRVYSPARHGGRIVRTYKRETVGICVE